MLPRHPSLTVPNSPKGDAIWLRLCIATPGDEWMTGRLKRLYRGSGERAWIGDLLYSLQGALLTAAVKVRPRPSLLLISRTTSLCAAIASSRKATTGKTADLSATSDDALFCRG